MPLERTFVYVFKFPFHTNVCMLKLSLLSIANKNGEDHENEKMISFIILV
jgi:hypothetical protein